MRGYGDVGVETRDATPGSVGAVSVVGDHCERVAMPLFGTPLGPVDPSFRALSGRPSARSEVTIQ